jgi:glycosyltransferase involved in cell wall biosynthesis
VRHLTQFSTEGDEIMVQPIDLAVVARLDMGKWRYETGSARGLPYGLDRVNAHGFAAQWSDAAFNRLLLNRYSSALFYRLESSHPGLQGVRNATFSRQAISKADVVLSIFEDAGLTAGRMRALRIRPYSSVPLVMMSCWLAETCQHASPSQISGLKKSLSGVDRLLVFSTNQVDIIAERLGYPSERITPIPFGIDTDFYRQRTETPTDGPIVAVGRDRSRDYRTFIEAVGNLDREVVLVTGQGSVAELRAVAARNIELRADIDHDEYLRLLHQASLVVITTHGPAYPGGQSTLLEAMSAGVPCAITRSDAIDDYVDDDCAILLPKYDPHGVREKIQHGLADPRMLETLGVRGAAHVRGKFSYQTMWHATAEALKMTLPLERAPR